MVVKKYFLGNFKQDGGTPKLMASKPAAFPTSGGDPYFRGRDICYRCVHNKECRERQRLGLWVLCEIPDEMDYQMGDIRWTF